MANNPNASDNLQPFKPGDIRINRNGRPKSFDAFRKLCQAKMNEPAEGADGKPIVREQNGKRHIVTNAEMFVETWMKSKDRKSFAEFTYGKVKEEIDVTTDGESLKPETMKPSEIAERVAALLKIKDANDS